jgi:hypothetical protein
MKIGPDGWIDRFGNYHGEEDLAREEAERRADARRIEKLYVVDEYKLFFLTKQPSANAGTEGRSAYISVKPFSVIPEEALDQMRSSAEPWSPQTGSRVRIEVREPLLVFHDDITQTESQIFVGELDPDVRQRLRASQGAEFNWGNAFNAAVAANPSKAVSTQYDISVHRPLTLKKAAPVI